MQALLRPSVGRAVALRPLASSAARPAAAVAAESGDSSVSVAGSKVSSIKPIVIGPFKIHFIRMFREEVAKNEPYTEGFKFYNAETTLGRFSASCLNLGFVASLIYYFAKIRPAKKEKARIAALKGSK